MPWATIGLLAPIAGGLLSGAGSFFGGQMQADAASQGINTEWAMYAEMMRRLAPYAEGGQMSLQALEKLMGLGPGGKFDPNAPLVKPFTVQDYQQSP